MRISDWSSDVCSSDLLAGLQLGLGFALALLSLDLMATAPLIAVPTLAVLLFLLVVPAAPAVPAGLALATLLALWLGAPGIVLQDLPAASLPPTSRPSPHALQRSLSLLILPPISSHFPPPLLQN